MSKYEIFSGQYFPVFSPNVEKYGPEKTPYWAIFNPVELIRFLKGVILQEHTLQLRVPLRLQRLQPLQKIR